MRRIVMDVVIGSSTSFVLLVTLALLPGDHFFSLRELGTTIGLFILTLVNFVILLNLLTWLSPRLKWAIFISVNVAYAVWSSFEQINIKTLRNSLFVICSVLVLLNILLSSLNWRKKLA